MNITIELPNEIYASLERRARGATIAETIEQVLAEAQSDRHQAVIEQLRDEGKILPKQLLPPDYQRNFKPIEVQGKPVSECLIEERR